MALWKAGARPLAARLTEGASPRARERQRVNLSGPTTEGAVPAQASATEEVRLTEAPAKVTPAHALHLELGARMVSFAGFDMPLHYPGSIMAEHRHTRAQAALFDVSHMGQLRLEGTDAAAALEALVPGDIRGLAVGRMRYTLLTNAAGGILDDLIVTREADGLHLVVNAACVAGDIDHIEGGLAGRAHLSHLEDRGLLALQGPASAQVMARHAPAAAALAFMSTAHVEIAGAPCVASRSGYTGEDGFEISLAAENAIEVARRLLDEPEVAPAGLGARDSLRLEAGLCLYGHDIDTTTTPVEAALQWTIAKRRREAGDFPGADVVRAQLAEGPARRRVGIRPEGRAPAREHSPILASSGELIGEVTSGGFAPTLGAPIAMGYVQSAFAATGTEVGLRVRGRTHPGRVVALPFVPHRYAKT